MFECDRVLSVIELKKQIETLFAFTQSVVLRMVKKQMILISILCFVII